MKLPIRHTYLIEKPAQYPELGQIALCGMEVYDGRLVAEGSLVCYHCKVIEATMDSVAGPFDRVWSVDSESPNWPTTSWRRTGPRDS